MTRQWLAVPEKMCQNHVLGEHAETHMFMEKMIQGHSLDGFREGSMFFGAEYVKARHDILAPLIAGHGSPLTLTEDIKEDYPLIVPSEEDVKKSLGDLFTRCKPCAFEHLKTVGKV